MDSNPFLAEGEGEGHVSCSLFETTQVFSQCQELEETAAHTPHPVCPHCGGTVHRRTPFFEDLHSIPPLRVI